MNNLQSISNTPTVSIYLEPSKHKLQVELDDTASVGDVVKGMVAHMQEYGQGFDIGHYLKEKIGEGYAPEWQLFRENADCQLLPPGALFRELTPPLGLDEVFTLKVNAKVAAFEIPPHLKTCNSFSLDDKRCTKTARYLIRIKHPDGATSLSSACEADVQDSLEGATKHGTVEVMAIPQPKKFDPNSN